MVIKFKIFENIDTVYSVGDMVICINGAENELTTISPIKNRIYQITRIWFNDYDNNIETFNKYASEENYNVDIIDVKNPKIILYVG